MYLDDCDFDWSPIKTWLFPPKKEREVLPEAYTTFAKVAAVYANEQLPSALANVCGELPAFAARTVYYTVNPIFCYVWRQAEKKLEVSKRISEAKVTKVASRVFCFARTQLCHKIFSPRLMDKSFRLEGIFLQMGEKIKKNHGERAHILFQTGAASVAESLDLAKKARQELKSFNSYEDAIIARLHWYKSEGKLPKSFPDPDKESINRYNLNQKLDEALAAYLDGLSQGLVRKIVPESVKWGAFGPLYFLEGQDALNAFFRFLMCDCAVKIVADPHLFAISILFGFGLETADFEIDGFGPGRREKLLKVGQAMTNALLEGKWSYAILKIFEESKLKRNPEGILGLEQKKGAQEALQKFIKKTLLEMIGKDTWTTWFTGNNLSNLFAEKAISFLNDPSYRFIVLSLIEALCTEIQNKRRLSYIKTEAFSSLTDVVSALFDHVFEGSTLVTLKTTIVPRAVDAIFSKIEEPREEAPPWKEALLRGLTPTIKEITLYARVLAAFRKGGVEFTGDAKFWELFVREGLSLFIEDQFEEGEPKTSVNLSKKRDKVIDNLLACSELQLLVALGQIPIDPAMAEAPDGWSLIDPLLIQN